MINSLRGMRDFLDDDGKLYEFIINTCASIVKNYGYSFIETPKLESSALFHRSVGDSSDIVGKEMYEFNDKGGDFISLRPEGTAGVLRAFMQAKMDKSATTKRWFYHGSMFRYERPQRGRQREFHQFGIECFGINDIKEDALIIIMASKILNKLGIKYTLKLNSLGNKDCMIKFKEKLEKYVLNIKNELCDDCKRRISTNILRILDCKNEKCNQLLKNAPSILLCLDDESKNDFDNLQKFLVLGNVSFEIDDRLVRGLDYYSKTAFEFISDEIGAKSAIIGGGRYDELASLLGGKSTPAVGWAMGIERIMEILGSFQNRKKGIYLCALDESLMDKILTLSFNLRENFQVELSYEAKNIMKHLNLADKKNAEIFLCLGEDEAKNNEILYKNLITKEQKHIKIQNLENEL